MGAYQIAKVMDMKGVETRDLKGNKTEQSVRDDTLKECDYLSALEDNARYYVKMRHGRRPAPCHENEGNLSRTIGLSSSAAEQAQWKGPEMAHTASLHWPKARTERGVWWTVR